MSGHFADRLFRAIDRAGAPLCVGLDPVYERLPAGLGSRGSGAGPDAGARAFETFSLGVLDAVAGIAPVVKLQAACYEVFGSPGVEALHRVCASAVERGMIAVLDAKRGDIGLTAERYAQAAFADPAKGGAGADALTVSAYLGFDTLEPYLSWTSSERGRAVFVLVRTSNPGSDDVQSTRLADGRTVAELMADGVARLGAAHKGRSGFSAVGAVVAATKPDDAAALRERMPEQVFLVPGYGAQGGSPETVRELFRPRRSGEAVARGALVTASRSVIYPMIPDRTGWKLAVADAARRVADELRSIAT